MKDHERGTDKERDATKQAASHGTIDGTGTRRTLAIHYFFSANRNSPDGRTS
jgi:hypothetical protein